MIIEYEIDSFIANNVEEANKKLDDDYLTTNAIINIHPMDGKKLKVFYHKPKNWDVINCFIKLPEWVKKKYNVKN
uniref:Uncharacterized protein n=1 Tax=viral metagenome TaxID=1070528 RepID=A0A6M3L4B8_9ZZZZ